MWKSQVLDSKFLSSTFFYDFMMWSLRDFLLNGKQGYLLRGRVCTTRCLPRAIIIGYVPVLYSLCKRFLNALSRWIFIPNLQCWYFFSPICHWRKWSVNYPQSLSLWVTVPGLKSILWPSILRWVCGFLNHCIWEEMVLQVWNPFFLKEERDKTQQA